MVPPEEGPKLGPKGGRALQRIPDPTEKRNMRIPHYTAPQLEPLSHMFAPDSAALHPQSLPQRIPTVPSQRPCRPQPPHMQPPTEHSVVTLQRAPRCLWPVSSLLFKAIGHGCWAKGGVTIINRTFPRKTTNAKTEISTSAHDSRSIENHYPIAIQNHSPFCIDAGSWPQSKTPPRSAAWLSDTRSENSRRTNRERRLGFMLSTMYCNCLAVLGLNMVIKTMSLESGFQFQHTKLGTFCGGLLLKGLSFAACSAYKYCSYNTVSSQMSS